MSIPARVFTTHKTSSVKLVGDQYICCKKHRREAVSEMEHLSGTVRAVCNPDVHLDDLILEKHAAEESPTSALRVDGWIETSKPIAKKTVHSGRGGNTSAGHLTQVPKY